MRTEGGLFSSQLTVCKGCIWEDVKTVLWQPVHTSGVGPFAAIKACKFTDIHMQSQKLLLTRVHIINLYTRSY